MSSFFQGFDAFQKSKSEVQVRTKFGATISLLAGVVMALLFVSELVYWRKVVVVDHILVDKTLGDRNVDVSLDIQFHQLSCGGAWAAFPFPPRASRC